MTSIRPLISQQEIATAVQELGRRITADYRGKDLTVLGILTGSLVLVADLMREIALPHQLGLIQASSYRGTAKSPGELHINVDFIPDIQDRDVLLIDDIFDTGRTLTGIAQRLQEFHPRSIHSAVLLWKKSRSVVEATPDYSCFEIPDEFVVGYGLDFNNHYRHLPYVGVMEEEPTF